MKWNRRNDLTLNTYFDKYSCNSHCAAKIPRNEESESVMRDISAYLQCSMGFTNTVCFSLEGNCQPYVHIYLYPSSAAVSSAEVTLQILRFRWAFFLIRHRRKENSETSSGCGLSCSFPLQYWGTLLPLNRLSIFSTWKWRL